MHAKFGSDILKAKKVIHQIDEKVNVNNNNNNNNNDNSNNDTKCETIQLQKNFP
jgi:hypothetical protein